MELELIFERYNPWWNKQYKQNTIPREEYLEKLKSNLKNKQVIFLTGLRRVGKTTLIKQFIEYLIEEKIPAKRILFLSFDDPYLSDIKIIELIEKFRQINSIKFEEKIYLLFDEIGFKDDFSRELKIINDNQNVKIYATGSNSLKLADSKAFLTGRVFTIPVHPLDFEEYLKFKNINIEKTNEHLKEKYFEEYLKIGGMPEYVLTNNPEYITSLVEDIIYKDIARSFKIKNITKLHELFILLCERVGKRISYNKLGEILNLDNETVAEYISYFEETFLFKIIQRYSKSANERIKSPKKVYIADNGIKNVFTGYKDTGGLFENYTYNELIKTFTNITYYYENDKEIDFIIRKNLKESIALEVTFNKEEKDLTFFKESKFENKHLITSYKDISKLKNI